MKLPHFFFGTHDISSVSRDLRTALNVGTTLTTRFWISLFSFALGGQLASGQGSMFSHAGYVALFETVSRDWWVAGLFTSGALMLWRTLTPKAVPLWGWISNGFAVLTWGLVVASRVIVMGNQGFLSTASVVLLMAAWCNVRTEATNRDKETA